LASLAVAAAVALPDSPFKLDAAGSWYFGDQAGRAAPNVPLLLTGSAIGFAGLVMLVRVWLRLVQALRQRPGAPLWRLAVLLACWSAPMLIVAPMFSRDLYSYAAQGEMVARHVNPYLHGPSVMGGSPFARWVDGYWIHVPSPYGPLFLVLASLAVRLAGHSLLTSLVLLRLIAVCGVVLLAVAIPRIARRCGHDPGLAFAIGAASPLIVFTLVGGGHNDALMAGLLGVGVLCALANHKVAAIAVIACAGAVKAPALLAVVVLAWTWTGSSTPARVRARALAGGLALSAGVLTLWSFVAGFGFGWVGDLARTGTVTSWAAPATWLGQAGSFLGHHAGLQAGTASWITFSRLACAALMVAICVYVLLRIDRLGLVQGVGLILVAVAVLGPVLQPWYLIWGLALLACVPGALARKICLGLASVTPFMGLPGGTQLAADIARTWPVTAVALAAGLALVLLTPLGSWANPPADPPENVLAVHAGTDAGLPRA
jgi:alpha-1,6-mannosyltransferase